MTQQVPMIEVPRDRLHGDPGNPSLGCGDYATVLDKVISPGGLDVPCDEKYISTDYANTIERYDTVALRFVSSTPGVAGGNLVYDGAQSLEWFVNGLDKQQSQNQAAPLYSSSANLTAFGQLLPGDGYPIRKGQGDTNAFTSSTSNPGAGQGAVLVENQDMDFAFQQMAIEYAGMFEATPYAGPAVQTAGPAQFRSLPFFRQGDASYMERIYEWLKDHATVRIQRSGQGSTSTLFQQRIGDIRSLPSPFASTGNRAFLENGTPIPFMRKTNVYGLRTNRRPKVDLPAIARFFLDIDDPFTVGGNLGVPVPANLSAGGAQDPLLGSVFILIKVRLWGAMLCNIDDVKGGGNAGSSDDKKLAAALVQGATSEGQLAQTAVALAQGKNWRDTGFAAQIMTLAATNPAMVASLVRSKAQS
jgi:hypothetical protein